MGEKEGFGGGGLCLLHTLLPSGTLAACGWGKGKRGASFLLEKEVNFPGEQNSGGIQQQLGVHEK